MGNQLYLPTGKSDLWNYHHFKSGLLTYKCSVHQGKQWFTQPNENHSQNKENDGLVWRNWWWFKFCWRRTWYTGKGGCRTSVIMTYDQLTLSYMMSQQKQYPKPAKLMKWLVTQKLQVRLTLEDFWFATFFFLTNHISITWQPQESLKVTSSSSPVHLP